MLVFHLETHPNYTCYTQCITFNIFPSYVHEVSYSLFGMVVMYWFPLIVIFYTYTSIFMEICRRSKERTEGKARNVIRRAVKISKIIWKARNRLFSNLLGNKIQLCDILNNGFFADRIRRSSSGFLSRARVRTLKMTITIIAVFLICWSPYYVMSVWWVCRFNFRGIFPVGWKLIAILIVSRTHSKSQ